MFLMRDRADLPVLLLHNIDPSWEPAERDLVIIETERFEHAVRNFGHPITSVPICDSGIRTALQQYNPDDFIAFNWCEEIPGVPYSEALVAKILEELRFTFTGSTYDVLRFCGDKRKVKTLLRRHGIPTPLWKIYTSNAVENWNHFPAIVKPPNEHCSAGVTPDAVVTSPAELKNRVEYVLNAFKQPALVEDFIDGREFHVSLWDNGEIQMLPPAEMDFAELDDVHDRLCTYDSKFKPGSFHYVKIGLKLPAPLSNGEYQLLEDICTRVYRITGCRDYARLDLRLRDGIFYVLDVNPNSDITADASMACAAEIAGYSYGEMLSRIINIAARRHPLFGKHDI
jgi:D-alanine-D-alanine ligase